ncbi:uncharacterized protein PRCAT00002659001 [Priceomyces carsonii]|uniref:uncharacterized protein n=1 Tax=Priceomyces carsonii TaxID=28549 RepID=UPI002EDB075D|nr:unnamed protein product [Priceomyces carsonii]
MSKEAENKDLLQLFVASTINGFVKKKKDFNKDEIEFEIDAFLTSLNALLHSYSDRFKIQKYVNNNIDQNTLAKIIENSPFCEIANVTKSKVVIQKDSNKYESVLASTVVSSTIEYSKFLISRVNDLLNESEAVELNQVLESNETRKIDELLSEVGNAKDGNGKEQDISNDKDSETLNHDKKELEQLKEDVTELESVPIQSQDSDKKQSTFEKSDVNKNKSVDTAEKEEIKYSEKTEEVTGKGQNMEDDSDEALEQTPRDAESNEIERDGSIGTDRNSEDGSPTETKFHDAASKLEEILPSGTPHEVSPPVDSGSDGTTHDDSNLVKPLQNSLKRSASPSVASSQHKRFQHIAINLLNSIQEHRFSSPFLQAVNKREAPDYYDLIYEPKDLKNILKSVKLKQEPAEYNLIKQLKRDIMLMFANCVMYNQSNESLVDLTKSMRNDVNNIFSLFEEAELDIRQD